MKKNLRTFILFISTVLLLHTAAHAQQNKKDKKDTKGLNKEEQKIIEYIDANMPRAIALLKEAVNVNSGTLNIEGVKKVGALFAKELEAADRKSVV